jgi:heavy metal sensor kinase
MKNRFSRKIFNWAGWVWHSLWFRLIALYIVLVGLTLLIFSIYFYFQLQQHEQDQLDANLETTALQIIPSIDLNSGPPHFRQFPDSNDTNENSPSDLRAKGYMVRLLGTDGKVVGGVNQLSTTIPLNFPLVNGYSTVPAEDNKTTWRIYTQELEWRQPRSGGQGEFVGWIQVGWPTFLTYDALADAYKPILLAIPIVILLAALGGWFLAKQVLGPITRITRTAQTISSTDLAGRIELTGSTAEIGRLATTFNDMLDRLQGAFERERRFTADASHELRTPLTALKGQIEVSLDQPRSQTEYIDTLKDANTEVDRLIRLSNSLLSLSRMDQGQQKFPRNNVDLSDLLDSLVETMQPLAEAKAITLSGQFTSGPVISGNFDQLTRLFMNLLDNALKYTLPGGKVTVSLKEIGSFARIDIADNGQGIPKEHLPHLFERFYRVHSDRTSSSGGTGLGLAIAYEIVRWHQGKITVESKLNEGTVFSVYLPKAH